MVGESHAPGTMTYAVTRAAAAQFRVGEPIGTGRDLHGDPMTGRVVAIKEGSQVALIVVELPPCGSSSASSPGSC